MTVIAIHGPARCPFCGAALNAATSASGDPIVPGPGDLTVCFTCAEALVFDDRMAPQPLSAEARAELDEDAEAEIATAQRNVRAFRAELAAKETRP